MQNSLLKCNVGDDDMPVDGCCCHSRCCIVGAVAVRTVHAVVRPVLDLSFVCFVDRGVSCSAVLLVCSQLPGGVAGPICIDASVVEVFKYFKFEQQA